MLLVSRSGFQLHLQPGEGEGVGLNLFLIVVNGQNVKCPVRCSWWTSARSALCQTRDDAARTSREREEERVGREVRS